MQNASDAVKMTTNPPSQTLYIKNLKDRVRKEEAKRVLYCLFKSYGQILDVIVMRNEKMRGQAFVVFDDLQSAVAAQKGLNNFVMYDRRIEIDFARTKSRAVKVAEDLARAELADE